MRAFDRIPHLGWVTEPSPVDHLPELAQELGLEYLGVKRDDRLGPLAGGNKVRKLDYLLAEPPFKDAPAWRSLGAIGSGHLVAMSMAAQRLGRRLSAHCFWEPPSGNVLENLAFIAGTSHDVAFYPSRLSMAVQRPALLLGAGSELMPVVPPGGSTPAGLVGFVRAGLELAEQVARGELPAPERIYVALGSGGTAVGLATGLRLAGLATEERAVATLEPWLSRRARIDALHARITSYLERAGVTVRDRGASLSVARAHVGGGYGVPTEESLALCAHARLAHLPLEPVYTGKAMAALFAEARLHGLRRVLFWLTTHRRPLPEPPGWRGCLPAALSRRLERVSLQPAGSAPT